METIYRGTYCAYPAVGFEHLEGVGFTAEITQFQYMF